MLRTCATAVALLCLMAGPGRAQHAAHAASGPQAVDINHASLEELAALPGMTRVWAVRVVRFRPYRGKNQLLLDGVLPGRVYEKIEERIVAHRSRKEP